MSSPIPPKPPTVPPYATHVEGRSPKFKTHTSLNNAHLAVTNHYPPNDVYVYELGPDGWQVIEEYIIPESCTKCGGGFEYEMWGRTYKDMYRSWGDRHLKEYQKPLICHKCYQRSKDEHNAMLREKRERKQLKELKDKYDV